MPGRTTYNKLYGLSLTVLSIVSFLILAIFVVYGEWVNLAIVLLNKKVLGTCFFGYLYRTNSNISLFLFLLTNVLAQSRFG